MTRKLENKAGTGISGENTFPNGEVHRFRFEGVIPVEEFQDNLLSLYVWAWSMKDYLKEVAKGLGKDPRYIESLVDSSPDLQLVSDIANRSKHGTLNKSRSGRFASLSGVKFTASQQSVSSITVYAFDVVVNVLDPDQVEYAASVLSDSGVELGNAKEILSNGIAVWERRGCEYATSA
ncbi:hypothetical protein [Nitrosomonas sp. ANs5]|uniref:hypothetical protein n=1 Tax=Nitrosomonas sp. ANs5 TaxID=3423941 RepID=UPI003D355D0D